MKSINRRSKLPGEVNIVAVIKGRERYVFMFEDKYKSEALRVIGKFAENPDLSFSWFDAAAAACKVRRS